MNDLPRLPSQVSGALDGIVGACAALNESMRCVAEQSPVAKWVAHIGVTCYTCLMQSVCWLMGQ